VLRNKEVGVVADHCLGEDDARAQQFAYDGREFHSRLRSSTVSIAPIQAVRNMNSWITGQRPDGKHDLPTLPAENFEVVFDEEYIRV
jgi:hypothetical protein